MDRRLIALSLLGLAAAGCGRAAPPTPTTPAGRMILAELPGLHASPHAGLQAELALLEAERGLPLQLAPASAPEGAPGDGAATAAARLKRAFPSLSRNLVTAPLEQIYAGGPLTLSPVQIERGRELLRKQAAASAQFRECLPGEAGGWGPQLADGILADVSFLAPLQIGCRLEAVAAAVALADDQPHAGLPHLQTMLQAARALAAEPNVTTRVAAAGLRADALCVLGAIVNHPAAQRETHEQLFALLAQESAAWPSDARAWIGDRSAGLLVYELVRDGQYLSLLEVSEVELIQSQGVLRATSQAVMRNIDEDERFYLQAMRRMIEACGRPHHERQAVLTEIRGELAQREATANYPLVAGKLLLADFETAHQRQAEDFARTQAWLLALGTALGREPAAVPLNPLSGSPYALEQTPLTISVVGLALPHEEQCLVPIRR